jgi:CDP-diacylglycerol--glycerol-3-phosphate 3-phosphatidyltransferase
MRTIGAHPARPLWTIPNALGVSRVLLVPVLWGLAWAGWGAAVGWGVLLAGLTDALDGPIARRQGLADDAGAKLDSLGDNLLAPSMLAWVLMFEPVLLDYRLALGAWVALFLASIGTGLVKFRRFGGLHLWSSKVAGFLQYAFVVHTLLAGAHAPLLFWVAVASGIASSAETLALQLRSDVVDGTQGSIWRRRAPGADPTAR